jgi:hypothetical protein
VRRSPSIKNAGAGLGAEAAATTSEMTAETTEEIETETIGETLGAMIAGMIETDVTTAKGLSSVLQKGSEAVGINKPQLPLAPCKTTRTRSRT